MFENIFKKLLVLFALIIAANGVLADDLSVTSKREVECLAKNIYFESRGENRVGQMAVAWVTLNRTEHKNWPSTICKVVYQPHQFSWTKMKLKIVDKTAYSEAWFLAQSMIDMFNAGNVPKEILAVKDSLYFDSLTPKKRYTRIGRHNFR